MARYARTGLLFAGVCALPVLLAASLASKPPAPQTSLYPTFSRDVAPLIYQNCASCHHVNEPGADCGTNTFPLITYEDVKRRGPEIVSVTQRRLMPPWLPEHGFGDFTDERRLTDAQIRLLAEWVRQGTPPGDASEVPPVPQYSSGWQLGQPDLVLQAAQAHTIPASGPDVFWNFIFSPNLKTKKYVRAVEVCPGSALGMVHHANVVLDPARSGNRLESSPGAGFPGMDLMLETSPVYIPSHFLFWKPGSTPWLEPSGLALQLDPGTDLILNAHFMTSGMAMAAKPSLGLYFTDQAPDRLPMLIELQNDEAIDIPAGTRDFLVSDDFRLPVDSDVLAVYPHAHYLGRLLEGYATLPNGERKWLIRIPEWDPAWQAVYHYRAPVSLPKGTVISMRYHFDNSAANPRNASHPPRRVVGGNQSTDEMAHLWLQVLPHGNGNSDADQRIEIQSALLQHRADRYNNDFASRLALGALLLGSLDASGAVPVLEQAIQINPKQEEAHRFLGMALAAEGRTAEAIVQFRAAVALQSDDSQALYPLARALVKAGKLDDANQDFAQAIAADPQNADLHVDFGELLLRQDMADAALQQFDAALKIDGATKAAVSGREAALAKLHASDAR